MKCDSCLQRTAMGLVVRFGVRLKLCEAQECRSSVGWRRGIRNKPQRPVPGERRRESLPLLFPELERRQR